MLTNEDLKKLKKLVHDEVKDENEDLESSLIAEMKLLRFRLEEKVDNLDYRVRNLEKSNTQILKEIKKLKKDINDGIGFNDKNIVKLEKRVKIIELKLDLETPEFAVV